MTGTQSPLPSAASKPAPFQAPASGRVPVATTIVVFAIVAGLLAYIALLA